VTFFASQLNQSTAPKKATTCQRDPLISHFDSDVTEISSRKIAVRLQTMSAHLENGLRDACDLSREGQERLEGKIAPPQTGGGFNVDSTVSNSI